MNRLLKNVAGQVIPFFAGTSGGTVLSGVPTNINVQVHVDANPQASGAGTLSEVGFGVYDYRPTQAETNGDTVSFLFEDVADGMLGVVESFRTENVDNPVILAAVQPNYAPAKAGDHMGLIADQDIRNILGNVNGNLVGNVLGTIPSPSTLSAGAVDAILDRADGVSPGLTLRVAQRELVAALVNVSVAFALSAHTGPTDPALKPKFPPNARKLLGLSSADLQKLLAFAVANPDLGLLAPNLATACQQLSTALDAVRTSSA